MNRKNILPALALLAPLLLPAGAAAAEGDRLTASVGVDYSTGDYGQPQDTDMLAVAFAAKYETGRWTYRASVPWIRLTAPENVVAIDSGGLPIGPASAARRTESGFGDVVLGAAWLALYGKDAPVLLEVGAKVKLATADEDKGLGTGETDYSLQADLFKPYGAFTPFATLGYRWYGDPPGIDLRNVLFGSVGTTYKWAENLTLGAAYDFRGAIVDGGERVSELSLFASRRLSPQWQLQLYAIAGLSDGSPDLGGGVVLSRDF